MYNDGNIKNVLDVDWTKKPYILFLGILFILSRIPLLNLGFGSDSDAWRIANSAYDLHYFHVYHPSRFPGYPLPELFNSLIINYGWLATNITTMILSLISVIVFAKILNKLNIKNKGLLVITYTFLPILWINSANTMDYMWALTFILLTWFFIIKKQYSLAGLMMGLAIGSRITSAALILSFVYLIWIENKHIKNIIYYLVITSIMTLILFLPLFLQYNFKFLTYYPLDQSMLLPFILITLKDINYCFGTLTVAFGLILFILSFKSLWSTILKNDTLTLFLLFSTGIILLLFIKAPIEIAYLIPAIPFLLVLINNISKKKFFVVFCILLILNSFVSFAALDAPNIVEEGIVINNIEFRTNLLNSNQAILNSNIENSIIISDTYLPVICYLDERSNRNPKLIGMIGFDSNFETEEHWNYEKNIGYIYFASLNKIEKLKEKGYKIYYYGNALENTEYKYGYNLNDHNCSQFN